MTSTCASRHNGIHFLNIWTWTAKSSEPKMFPAFWLVNTLCATTAYNFSTTQLPKVFRRWGAYAILTWECECASRIFAPQRRAIFDLSFNFRTRRFSGQNIRKNTVLHDVSTFSRALTFFLLTLSSLALSLFWSSFYWLSLLWVFSQCCCICPKSEVWLLNLLRPSTIYEYLRILSPPGWGSPAWQHPGRPVVPALSLSDLRDVGTEWSKNIPKVAKHSANMWERELLHIATALMIHGPLLQICNIVWQSFQHRHISK